jgi:nitric oxide reductase subunit B
METLVWMRVPGDMVFSVGAVTLALFMARLLVGKWRGRVRFQPITEAALVPAE